MDRRYDYPPRPRFTHPRPRYDDRYYRPRYHPSPPPPPSPYRYPRPPPRPSSPYYYPARPRDYHSYYHHSRSSSSRHDDRRRPEKVSNGSTSRKQEEEIKSMGPSQSKEEQREATIEKEQKPIEEEKKPVIKEAVISFDSDGEDDWVNETMVQSSHEPKQEEPQEEKKKQEKDSLPETWISCQTEKGEVYYYNQITRKSVWDIKDIHDNRGANSSDHRPVKREVHHYHRTEIRQVRPYYDRYPSPPSSNIPPSPPLPSSPSSSSPSAPGRYYPRRYPPYHQPPLYQPRWADRRAMRRNEPYEKRYR
ncbi:hypothetical protein BCV72DRAFT_63999 [Rhizopus microsporus var. microsporus]|uniref:WW domain-containing protein n=2 Tax=Rhizopus microsporus TaxID=58291 RepID=A0A2G4T0I1_RHIZD|nr:uncharacterized protein RHIMIDRAFT_275258 [Rhizopus microsporus ATCC 52813]ORE09389.1 hypothetical protein BCV72DRAFT_63999 [Rhizopus microsporus var. microsporus]PHZ14497.1 hypothetical protein RHIMIDRAFT_275258 [Rhizopus microsporus ATCC 52813]